jgi:hypothetical protein
VRVTLHAFEIAPVSCALETLEIGAPYILIHVAHVCLKAWKVTKPSRNFGFFQPVGRRTGQGKPLAAIVARSSKCLKWPPSLKRKKL